MMNFKRWIFPLVGLWAMFGASLQAQTVLEPGRTQQLPLKMTPYLAGNFGELRPNHFHGGLDFKTQGTTGHPVYAFDDGYVARAAINAYGYGWVLYVAHPSGLTTVYGHLSTFADSIMTRVRDYQLQHEVNNPDINFAPGELPVKRGQQIALSGNTGNSGGPHVHFEIRDTERGEYYDPMVFFLDKIKDTMAPEVRGLYIYPQGGVANGSSHMQTVPLAANGAGGKKVTTTPTAWGPIGIGIKAYDRMDGTTNIYGVKAVRLYVDDTLVYSFREDNFVFDEHRFTNSVTDYREWRQNRSMIMKSFREPGNHLRMIRRAVNDGVIDINEERLYRLRYELQDAHGNQSSLRFNIRGVRTTLPVAKAGDCRQAEPDRSFCIDSAGFRFQAPAGSFYTTVDMPLKVQTASDPNRPCVSPLYTLGDEHVPLHGYCTLTIDLPDDVQDTSKLYIACMNGGSSPMISHCQPAVKGAPASITAEVRQLGRYAVRRDTAGPKVVLQGAATARRVVYTVSDAGSGVASWRGTVDGRFVPFIQNAQGQVVAHPSEYGITGTGRHKVQLTVTDYCGNETTVTTSY